MVNHRGVTLRPATAEDAGLLLAWRNDPETRRTSRNTSVVGDDEHRAWLVRALADPTRRLYIAELFGQPAGTVRADRREDAWELSWTVAPDLRGRGLGKDMVVALASQIDGPLVAAIKPGNIASVRIAEAVGMKFEFEKEGALHFRRE